MRDLPPSVGLDEASSLEEGVGGNGESAGQSSLIGSFCPCFGDKKVASERDSLCLRKPEVEVTHAQWLLFL